MAVVKVGKLLAKGIPARKAYVIILIIIFMIFAAGFTAVHLLSSRQAESTLNDIWLKPVLDRVQQNPEDMVAISQLGYIYLEMGDYNRAVNWLEKGYKLSPESPVVRRQLALGYLTQGRYSQAIELLEPLAVAGIMNFQAHYTLGKAYYQAGNFQQAVESFSTAVAISPAAADAYYLLGLSYERIGELEQAVTSYAKAIKMVPDYEEVSQALQRISLEKPSGHIGGKE